MKWVILTLLLAMPRGEAAEPEFAHIDREVALAYGLAMLKEFYLLGRYSHWFVSMDELDLEDGTVIEATDGNGRTFAFVAFRPRHLSAAGFFFILEFCRGRLGEYSPSWGGDDPDIPEMERQFLTIEGDPTADYPGNCAHGL